MKLSHRTFATAAAGAMLVTATLLSSGALAQASSDDDWKFGAVIYGYLPSVSGSTNFQTGTARDINVNTKNIVTNLKFAFMGAIEAQKGQWGAFTDVMYLNLGASKSGTRDLTIGDGQLPAGINANATLDIKGLVWTLAGRYRAMSTSVATVDAFAGARLVNLKENLGWQFSADVGPFVGPGRQGSSEAKLNLWDGIVGAKGRVNLGADRKWFVPYYVDLGAGQSRFTWQGIGGIGYAFSWGELIASWRYLDYDFKSDRAIQKLTLSGPAIGVAFRW